MEKLIITLRQNLAEKKHTIELGTGAAGECYLRMSAQALPEAVSYLKESAVARFIGLWAAENTATSAISLYYAFEIEATPALLVLEVLLADEKAPSISGVFPVSVYFERRVTDGFGVVFDGAEDTRRLFLHENYPLAFHPLRKQFRNGSPVPNDTASSGDYSFKEFEGEGLYQVPVGPIHAGIIEPGHFRFSVIGETIFNLEVRLGYKHRGLEKLAEGKPVQQTIKLAEAVSGDESATNAVAMAMAAEKISGVLVPRRAWLARTLLLEMERVYSHLGDLAGMVQDVAYPVGAAPFFVLREEILRYNAEITGSRFLKGIVIPGGLVRDINQSKLEKFHAYTADFLVRLKRALAKIEQSDWVIDRFESTGVVRSGLVNPLNLSGPTARASGCHRDTRHAHPYGLYGEFSLPVSVDSNGDVLARFRIRSNEILSSIHLIQGIIRQFSPGEVRVSCQPDTGWALVAIEAPRGQTLHWLNLKGGVIDRWQVSTASFCNWLAIEHATIGNIVPDFPLINKSLGLSYSGNDL